ncbi:MAG: LytTR family DNA-binding domain-containing protein [Flavobacterium sp.]
MKIKTIIVDDEPLGIDILKNYASTLDYIEVAATFTNPLEAITYLSKKQVDLIFLDIEMPLINGIDLVDSLNTKPAIIFTTAYPQYAIDGFNLDAIDYLLKPISYKRFLKAVNKIPQKQTTVSTDIPEMAKPASDNKFIFVKSEYENLKINTDEIKFIEGLKDYLKIHLTNGRFILTLSNFTGIIEKIGNDNFMRVHNSFIVNIACITSIQRNRIIIDDKRIPISDTYKKAFFDKLKLQ